MPNYSGFDSIFAKIYKKNEEDFEEIKVKVTQLNYVYSEENIDASRIKVQSDEASVVDNKDLQEFQTIYVQFGSIEKPSPKRELLIIDSQIEGTADGVTLTLSCFPRAVLLRMASNAEPMKDIFQKCGISVVKQEGLRSEEAEPIKLEDEKPNNVIYINNNNPITSPSYSIAPTGLFQSPQIKNSTAEVKCVNNKVAYDAPDNLSDFNIVFKGNPDKDKVLGQTAWETLQNHIGNDNVVDESNTIGDDPNYITASDNKITVSNKDYNQDSSYSFHYKDEPGDIISFNFETGYREHLAKSNQKTSSVDLEGNLETSSVDTGESQLAEYKPTAPNIYEEHSELFKMVNLSDTEQFAQYQVWRDIFNDNPNLQYTIAYSEDADLTTQNLKLLFFPDPVYNKGDAGLFGGSTRYEMVDPSTGKVTEMVVDKDEADDLEAKSQISNAVRKIIATKLEGHKYDDPAMQMAANKICRIYGVQNYIGNIGGSTYEDYQREYESQNPEEPTTIERVEEEYYNTETGKIVTKVWFKKTQKTDFRYQNIDAEDLSKSQAESTRVYDPRIGGKEFFLMEKVNPPKMNIDPIPNTEGGSGVDQQDHQEVTKEERELYKGTVKLVGGVLTPHIISGKVCTLYGVSKKWGGNWFINTATHILDPRGGYTISLKLERDASGVISDNLGANVNNNPEKESIGDGVSIPETVEVGGTDMGPVSLTPQQYQIIIDVYKFWARSAWNLQYDGVMGTVNKLVPYVTSEEGKAFIKETYNNFEQQDEARGHVYSENDITHLKCMPSKSERNYMSYHKAYAMFVSLNPVDLYFKKEYQHNALVNPKQPLVVDILKKIDILFGRIDEFPDGDGGVLGNVEAGIIYDSDAYFKQFNFTYGTHTGDTDLIENKLRLNGELLSWILQYLSKWSILYRKEIYEYMKYQAAFTKWLQSLNLGNAESGLVANMYNIIKVFECGSADELYKQVQKNGGVVDPNQFIVPEPKLKSFSQPMKDGSILGEVGWGHSVMKKWGIKTELDIQYGLQNKDTLEPVIGVSISKEQAQNLFNADIAQAQAVWLNVKTGFGSSFNNLSDNKKVALTSLSYNSGARYAAEVVRLGKAGKWTELKSKWTTFIKTSQSGTENGLLKRRKIEAILLTQE